MHFAAGEPDGELLCLPSGNRFGSGRAGPCGESLGWKHRGGKRAGAPGPAAHAQTFLPVAEGGIGRGKGAYLSGEKGDAWGRDGEIS